LNLSYYVNGPGMSRITSAGTGMVGFFGGVLQSQGEPADAFVTITPAN